MTNRSTMKSYAKVVQIAYETSASVEFRDTGIHNANLIDCNWFSVDCRSNSTTSADDGYYIAQPSGIYASAFGDLTNSSLGTGASGASAAPGVDVGASVCCWASCRCWDWRRNRYCGRES